MAQATFDLTDTHVLITGGAQGIGFQIAYDVLRSGGRATIWDYSDEALGNARKELAEYEDKLHTAIVDISNIASCREGAENLASKINVVVNNAGITRDQTFLKMEPESYEDVIQTNLVGAMHVTKAVQNAFVEDGAKRLINIASIVGIYGNFGQSNYAAAKSGLIGFTKSLAKELGPKGFTANAVCPGYTATPMVKAVPEAIIQKLEKATPLRRLASTADIAAMCMFLMTEQAAYINGAVLSVDGGLTL